MIGLITLNAYRTYIESEDFTGSQQVGDRLEEKAVTPNSCKRDRNTNISQLATVVIIR